MIYDSKVFLFAADRQKPESPQSGRPRGVMS